MILSSSTVLVTSIDTYMAFVVEMRTIIYGIDPDAMPRKVTVSWAGAVRGLTE